MPIDLRRLPKIVFRKLGREKVWGLASHPEFASDTPMPEAVIEIDATLRGRRRLEIITHEALHICVPGMDEGTVSKSARYISRILWKLGYRADDDAQVGN